MNSIAMRLFMLYIFLLGLFSCSSDNNDLIIPEEKLIAIFFDFHTAESVINRAPSDLKDSLKQVYQGQIFEIHEVERLDFIHDLQILENNPKRFHTFYEEVEKYGLDLKTGTLEGLNKNLPLE